MEFSFVVYSYPEILCYNAYMKTFVSSFKISPIVKALTWANTFYMLKTNDDSSCVISHKKIQMIICSNLAFVFLNILEHFWNLLLKSQVTLAFLTVTEDAVEERELG